MDSKVSPDEEDLHESNTINHAAYSAENRLRLKRFNAESVTSQYGVPDEESDCNAKSSLEKDIDNDILQRQNIQSTTLFINENDSILDFKSPQSKENAQVKLAKVTKTNITKSKKKNSKFELIISHRKKTAVKERKQSKDKSNECQLSIESSFFKSKTNTDDQDSTNDLKTAYVCPLCFKTCKDIQAQALHMKTCAVKNNISTRGLFEAIELQKRQADERKSMGLLSAPIIQDRKKPIPRKLNVDEESDLQLALAISKSLQEATELEEIVEIEELARTPNPCILDTSDTTCKGQLEKFGFRAASLAKSKRRNSNPLTVLQIRSEKERNYILTERISEILIGNESITQNFQERTRCDEGIKQKTILKSGFLQNLRNTDETLWSKTSLTPKQTYFYVTELSEYIVPQEKELEELNNSYENTIESVVPCKINDKNSENCEKDMYTEQEQLEEMSRSQRLNSFIEQTEECRHKQFVNTLVTNWGNTLNDSSASDLIIFVKNNKHIWAHKLVFYVRCSNILLDVTPNTNSTFIAIKEKICWTDTSYNIALVFLEFIYCGAIIKYLNVLEDSRVLCNLRKLARKYKVQELFIYLQKNTNALKHTDIPSCNKRHITHKSPPAIVNKVDDSKPNKINPISPICRDNEKLSSPKDIMKLGEEQRYSKNYRESSLTRSSAKLSLSCASNCTQSPTAKSPCNRQTLTDTRMKQSSQREIKCMTNINAAQHSGMSPDMFDDADDIITNCNEKYVNRMPDIECIEQFQNHSMVYLITPEGKPDSTSREGCIEKMNIIAPRESLKSISSNNVKSLQTNVNDIKNRSDTDTIKSGVRRSLTQALLNTPRSTKLKQNKVSDSSMKKTKSNFSIFIEKVQRENAMSDSDSYFDDYTLPVRSELNRNPFNINSHDDSDQCPTYSSNNIVRQKAKIKTKGLEMLDRNITIYEQNVITSRENDEHTECSIRDNFNVESRLTQLLDQNSEKLGNNDSKNLIGESIDSGEDSLEDAATIISSLSKNSTRKSMDNVDRSLKNDATISPSSDSLKRGDMDSEEDNLEDAATIIASPTPACVNNKTAFDSDVDTDENEISMYTKYKRKKINNSIAKYRSDVKKCILNVSVAQPESSENNEFVKEDQADDEDVAILSDIDIDNEDFTLPSVEKRVLEKSNNESQATAVYNNVDSLRTECVTMRDPYSPKTNRSSDGSYSCDTEIIVNDKDEHCTPTKISILNNQRSSFEIKSINDTRKLRSYKSDSNIELEGIRSQISSIMPICTESNLFGRDSPVLVSSSPEFNIDGFGTEACNENQIDSSTSNIKKVNDFDHILEKEVYLENVRIVDEIDSDTTSPATKKSSQVEKHNAIDTCDVIHKNFSSAVINKKNRNNEYSVVTDPSSPVQLKNKSNSTNISHCIRKLHKKSVSEENFSINAKNYANRASTFSGVSNVSQCKCGSFQTLNTVPSPVVIRDNVTPPPKYDRMRTPELHRELRKYGLKLQKRSKAVKLLTYIYNGLHPEVPTSDTIESELAVLSSEDGEPPAKKFNHDSSDINDQNNVDDDKYEFSLSQYSTQSSVNIIAEEMQVDDPETMNTLDNNPNIKEKFLKLLKQNQEIHNKILAYEPLCIESIHSLLKADGFKCKMNSLMDLLDEQCITFYCQESSARSRIRKNKPLVENKIAMH